LLSAHSQNSHNRQRKAKTHVAHDVGAIGDNGTMNVVVGVGKNDGRVNEILMMRVL
jgi:hypothetical protein